MVQPWIASAARQLSLQPSQIEAVVSLLGKDCSAPFIVRYRGDVTGGLDERQVVAVAKALQEHTNLEERRKTILEALEAKDARKSLLNAVRDAADLTTLEDLYAPFKQQQTTLADRAREEGHGPLAERIWSEQISNGELKAALGPRRQGVSHILAELISQSVAGRSALREHVWQHASLSFAAPKASGGSKDKANSGGKGKEKSKGGGGGGGGGGSSSSSASQSVADNLIGTSVRAVHLKPHRTLAINRAEAQKLLRVSITLQDNEWAIKILCRATLRPPSDGQGGGGLQWQLLKEAAADAFTRLLMPSAGRELRRRLTADAEAAATRVFASNLSALLLQRPVRGVTILGVDPGYRHGCKLAVISDSGAVLAHEVVYPHQPRNERAAASKRLRSLIQTHSVGVIALGDGTASQETAEVLSAALRTEPRLDDRVKLSVVSEAGASVLSVGAAAQAADPTLDAGAIGAASLARRLQDPLAELIKIDPKAIGVGMYQHDLPQKALSSELDQAVQSCVCKVGVDLHTASVALLSRLPGLNASRAAAIIAARPTNGFPSRDALLKVKGIGPKAFEQSAGFLRLPAASIPSNGEPLDCTAVHPESYVAARKLLAKIGRTSADLRSADGRRATAAAAKAACDAELAAACGVGTHTLSQIVDALGAAERDAREELLGPLLLGTQLQKLDQLKIGQSMEGVVRNVTSFGCFVNVGLKEDGLLHVSKMQQQPGGGWSDPLEAAFVGQLLKVVVLSVDVPRGRLGLGLAAASGGGGSSSSAKRPAGGGGQDGKRVRV